MIKIGRLVGTKYPSCLVHCQSSEDDVAWMTYAIDGHMMHKPDLCTS